MNSGLQKIYNLFNLCVCLEYLDGNQNGKYGKYKKKYHKGAG